MPVARALDDRPMVSDPAPASEPRYSASSMSSTHLPGEDILFRVDVNLEVHAKMKFVIVTSSGSTSTTSSQSAGAEGAPTVGT